MERLKGKVSIITGAGSGIGAQSAITFANEGSIVYAADVNEAGLKALLEKFNVQKKEGAGEIRTKVLNVAKFADTEKAVDEIKAEAGQIDVLVNNAGITRDATLLKMTEDQFDAVISVNLKGVFNVGKAVAKHMVEKQKGSIINTSSVIGVYGGFGQSNYAAAKAGVIGLTKTWAKELGKKGVRVNAVAPGYTKTEMLATVPEKVLAMLTEKTLLLRLGTPEDIANLYLFLASDESSYITGQTIGSDGGLVI